MHTVLCRIWAGAHWPWVKNPYLFLHLHHLSGLLAPQRSYKEERVRNVFVLLTFNFKLCRFFFTMVSPPLPQDFLAVVSVSSCHLLSKQCGPLWSVKRTVCPPLQSKQSRAYHIETYKCLFWSQDYNESKVDCFGGNTPTVVWAFLKKEVWPKVECVKQCVTCGITGFWCCDAEHHCFCCKSGMP